MRSTFSVLGNCFKVLSNYFIYYEKVFIFSYIRYKWRKKSKNKGLNSYVYKSRGIHDGKKKILSK